MPTCRKCKLEGHVTSNTWCRPCNAAYMRDRRLKDPIVKEKEHQRRRVYYERTCETRKQKSRDAYDPERARAYRLARLEHFRMYSREYSSRRSAVKRGTMIGPVDYRAILRREGPWCHLCGLKIRKMTGRTPMSLSFDHLVPISKGGAHIDDNIAPAHLRCNMRRGSGRIPAQLKLPSQG